MAEKGVVRNEFTKERDLVRIQELYVKGATQREISTVTGLDLVQVSHSLKELRERWRESISGRSVDELAKIDAVEKEAWISWELSKLGKKTTTQKIRGIKVGDKDAKPVDAETTNRQEESIGDIRWMSLVLECIKQRREMLGLDAPKQTENRQVTEPFKVFIGLDPDRV